METTAKRLKKKKYLTIAKKVIEGSTVKKAMLEAGYSKGVAKRPTEVIHNRTFKEILDELLPEEYVIGEHRKLYNEHRQLKQVRLDTIDDDIINKNIEGLENVQVLKNEKDGYTTLLINEVDKEARRNAVEMAYKLRGSFSPIKLEVKRTYEDLTDKEILELMKG